MPNTLVSVRTMGAWLWNWKPSSGETRVGAAIFSVDPSAAAPGTLSAAVGETTPVEFCPHATRTAAAQTHKPRRTFLAMPLNSSARVSEPNAQATAELRPAQ